jgi:hypothetical protein
MKNDKRICIVFGSGATFDSGYIIPSPYNGFEFNEDEGIPPIDRNLFKKIKLHRNSFPALWLLLNELKNRIISMENIWSLIDCGFKIRYGERNKIKDEILQDLLKKWGFFNEEDYKNFLNKMEYKYYSEYVSKGYQTEFNKTAEEESPHYFTGDAGREFRMFVYNIYSNLKKTDENNFKTLFQKFKNNKIKPDIITFNYDLLSEKNLSSDFRYICQNGMCNPFNETVIRMIKLHGSLNWLDKGASQPILFQNSPIKPVFSKDEWYKQPAMVPPTATKDEVIDKNKYDPIREIINIQWEYTKSILNNVDYLIFIGYSFPPTDKHAIKLFKENIKNNVKIFYCTKEKGRKDRIKEYVREKLNLKNIANIEIYNNGFSDFIENNIDEVLNSLY